MRRFDTNEEAGAASTAAGPGDAKAERPATPLTSNDQVPPDGSEGDNAEIDGADLFARIHSFLLRFISYPSPEASVAHLLWIVHTHLMDAWFTTPRLAALSPEPGSGKSRLLEITALLVLRPILSVMSSPAYVLRKIADQENRPTILYDEIDAVFGPQARGNEDLRAMVNAGYRRGATIGRCLTENGKIIPQDLPTYGAIAFGGLGDLPGTIMSRSIIIRMRKRIAGETVDSFRPSQNEPEGQLLRDELSVWAESVADAAGIAEAVMPEGIADRDADVWKPLLTVAELAGGPWPDMARRAALMFVVDGKEGKSPSLGVELLFDIKRCFGDEDKLPTRELLERLLADEEAPWGDIKGKKLDPRRLARMLRQFAIKSEGIRIGDETLKGYKREAFYDAWMRYLSTLEETATSGTTATDLTNSQKTLSSIVPDAESLSSCGGCGGDVAGPEIS